MYHSSIRTRPAQCPLFRFNLAGDVVIEEFHARPTILKRLAVSVAEAGDGGAETPMYVWIARRRGWS
jgi:hypothetical protein